ncbi:MAG TPA: ABC transporter ATP-binding protein [Candidatus Mcinerneyibacterium sp.]|nr:ABC transporter ATP-binding protein [Candidatus Mcinerneyibacterium sp.]
MNDIVKIDKLKIRFKDLTAVNNITLNIKKGEMFGFIGPDGAGKTTIIRTLCGIVKEFNGKVEMFDFNLRYNNEKIKKNIGYLSQNFSLYRDLTVDENIEFFAEIYEIKDFKKRRKELLQFTKMGDFRNRKAGNLSGGMKKKLALACTLIHRPKIIFLDEPTNGVDPVSRREFWEILSQLIRERVTIVMSTPYIDEAERCSRVALLNQGKLLSLDKPENLKKSLDKFIFEIILNDVRNGYNLLKNLNGIDSVQSYGDRLHVFLFEKDKKMINKINKILKKNNISIKNQEYISPALEDVFIDYLKKYKEE